MKSHITALGMACASLLLSACQSMGGSHIPVTELEQFQALPAEKRVMNEVRIRWEVRQDVTDYCAKASGMGREQAYVTPPLACAIWSVAHKECTIVTAPKTSHLALGHEVRHCFEGHFHR